MLRDFIQLFFPLNCSLCRGGLGRNEELICTLCQYRLPRTGSHIIEDDSIPRIFMGRMPVEEAHAYFRFEKGNPVQKLIYHLKYRGESEIGTLAGKWMGQALAVKKIFSQVDFMVPVPLHYTKLRKRGYNQCDYFARGLSSQLNIPVSNDNLLRKHKASSQTLKSRYDRWMNVSQQFSIRDPGLFENRHILLVDDVITTGATLEAAGQTLLRVPGVKISIAAIAAA